MNPNVLTVYTSPFKKIRLGRPYDGGYIIVDIPRVQYSTLLAGGISTDISFEEHFLHTYPNVSAFAFDGTIEALPKPNTSITFIQKNIGSVNTHDTTNLHDIINSNEKIFVKMDIEGGEIPWIKSLTDEHMNKFEQIVMEFHNPFTDEEVDVFSKINKNHVLVHFHGNNCCGFRNHRGVMIPNIFECTYLHKKYFTEAPLQNTEAIPGKLDMRNLIRNEELQIDYPPFVSARKKFPIHRLRYV